MAILDKIREALEVGDAEQVVNYIDKALKENFQPEEILNNALLIGMDKVAEKFRNNIVFIPHVLLSARAMAAGMQVLNTYFIAESKFCLEGRVVIGTIEGDLHDLGKNIVKAMLEREGFNVLDLGRDVTVHQFIQATREFKPHILAISASLTSTMGNIKKVIKGLEREGLKKEVLVMVGGVPITRVFAKEVGADLCPSDAGEAAKVAKEIYFSTVGKELSLIV